MTNSAVGTHDRPSSTDAQPSQRTIAFFADPRASIHLLHETITSLIGSFSIDRGLVDIGTHAGLVVAEALDKAQIPYEQMDFGQGDRYSEHPLGDDVPGGDYYRSRATGVQALTIDALGTVDANIVLIPAMVGPNEKLLDFSQGTLVGTVLTQLEEAGRDLILIDAPERGLRALNNGSYERATVHVSARVTT